MTVRKVPGVPVWFTNLRHRICVKRCRREGHRGIPIEGSVCIHCGHVWNDVQVQKAKYLLADVLALRPPLRSLLFFAWPTDDDEAPL